MTDTAYTVIFYPQPVYYSFYPIFTTCYDKHVLQHYLPERYKIQYNLRPRQHTKQLLSKTTEHNNRDIVRMLYKDAY